MKVQILKENLVKVVQTSNRFAISKAQMPVLAYLMIEANDKGIFLTATNLDVGIKLRVAGKILEPGAVGVSAKVLLELVQHLPLGGVLLESEESGLRVEGGKVKAKLPVLNAGEFPPFTERREVKGKIWVKEVAKDFDLVSFAISNDEARPVLTGFLWLVAKNQLVATDGYRLSLVSGMKGWEISDKVDSMLIPGKAVTQLLQVLTDFGVEECEFDYDEKNQQLFFFTKELGISVRLLAGEYPQYEAILPKETKNEVIVSREELLEAVRGVAIFARDSANIVKLTIKKKGLEVAANTAQVGEGRVEVEAEISIEKEESIAFNSKFLIDFLSHSTVERVGLKITDPLKPGLFFEVGNDNYAHVIMPVRVRE